MVKLKRCPFCEGEAHIEFGKGGNVFYWKEDGCETSTPLLYLVYCSSCSCRTGLAETPGMAIKLWNRRVNNDSEKV